MLEYSVAKPATSPDSASGKSKGVRLFSARLETNRIIVEIKQNGLANMNQWCGSHPCARIIPCIDSVPIIRTNGKVEEKAGILNMPLYAAARMTASYTHVF